MSLRTEIPHFPRRIAFETFERMIAKGPWLLIGGSVCPKPVGGYEPVHTASLALGEIYLYGDTSDYTYRLGFIRGVTPWHIEIIAPNSDETVLFILINPRKLSEASLK